MNAPDPYAGTTDLPPAPRGATQAESTTAALTGAFRLQFRARDGRAQYPPREVPAGLLRGGVAWRDADRGGRVLAATTIHVSFSPYFADRAPWPIVLVGSVAGPSIIAHALDDLSAGDEVELSLRLDAAGRGVMCATAATGRDRSDGESLRHDAFLPSARGRLLHAVGIGPQAPSIVGAALDAGASGVLVTSELADRCRQHGVEDERLVVVDGSDPPAGAWPVRLDFE